MKQLFKVASVATLMSLSIGAVRAQQGNFDFASFDPAQMQQRILNSYREQLEVTDDAEWKVLEPRIQKVMDARREAGMGGGGLGGLARAFGRGGQRSGQRSGAMAALGLSPNPEEEALQKAVDAKAPNADLKAALAKLLEARKQKQANLEKAQADLRQLLSVRQEASATLAGLL